MQVTPFFRDRRRYGVPPAEEMLFAAEACSVMPRRGGGETARLFQALRSFSDRETLPPPQGQPPLQASVSTNA